MPTSVTKLLPSSDDRAKSKAVMFLYIWICAAVLPLPAPIEIITLIIMAVSKAIPIITPRKM